jgi:hypothetical protein
MSLLQNSSQQAPHRGHWIPNRCVRNRSHGGLVIYRRYAIPIASVREAHEKRKHA